MRELTRDGKTIIFSTHDFNIAVNQADKIWLILENNLIEGAPEDLMLSGAFEHLFESSIVQFSSGDGNFSFLRESRGSIFVRGEGLIRKWTERALIREGYQLSSSITNPYVQITDGTDQKWLLTSNDTTKSFSSIYELIRILQK
jgi:iron complex transport system ATP-binding protein